MIFLQNCCIAMPQLSRDMYHELLWLKWCIFSLSAPWQSVNRKTYFPRTHSITASHTSSQSHSSAVTQAAGGQSERNTHQEVTGMLSPWQQALLSKLFVTRPCKGSSCWRHSLPASRGAVCVSSVWTVVWLDLRGCWDVSLGLCFFSSSSSSPQDVYHQPHSQQP